MDHLHTELTVCRHSCRWAAPHSVPDPFFQRGAMTVCVQRDTYMVEQWIRKLKQHPLYIYRISGDVLIFNEANVASAA